MKARFAWLNKSLTWFIFGIALTIGRCGANMLGCDKIQIPNVFICTSQRAYTYHTNRSCIALDRCGGTVKSVSRTDAEDKLRRRECSICKQEDEVYQDDDDNQR